MGMVGTYHTTLEEVVQETQGMMGVTQVMEVVTVIPHQRGLFHL